MSRIYFNTRNVDIGDVEVSGREAHLLHFLDKQIGTGILYNKLSSYNLDDEPFSNWIEINYLQDVLSKSHLKPDDIKHIITALHTGMDNHKIKYEGEWLLSWPWFLTMNSLYGSDVMCLIGQMSAQMEIYAHIKKENFTWFSNLIKQALEKKILRQDMGWDDVISLCERDDVDLIVMSYSVCEGFPNVSLSGLPIDDEGYSDFDDMTHEQRWDLCVKNLNPGVEITPESIRCSYQ